MARSSTVNITATGTNIVTQALYEIAMYGPHDTIPSAETADCLVVLNYLVKQWMGDPDVETKGLKMWQRTETSLDLGTAGAAISYSLASGASGWAGESPVNIRSVTFKDSNNQETTLSPMTAEEFQAITDKTQTGTPTRYYYERGYSGGTIYLNRVPSQTSSCYLDILYLRPLYDVDQLSDDVDFPQQWYLALYLNLAVLLGPRYGKEVYPTTQQNAFGALQKAQAFYPEDVNVSFEPGRED